MCSHQIAYEERKIYDILEISDLQDAAIQAGGNARIMRGYHSTLNNSQVGVKRIRIKATDDEDELRAALMREIAVWCTLRENNLNVLELLGTASFEQKKCHVRGYPAVFLSESTIFCYYENGDLSQYLSQNQLNDLDQLSLLKDVAAGVDYIHGQNIVHGDLKQGNVVIDHARRAKICDFGSSFALEGCSECPAGLPEDTPGLATDIYLSPEVWEEDQATSHRSDIWALGCLLFEVQTGERVYKGKSSHQIMGNMTKRVPPATMESFSALGEISREVGRIALACLSFSPCDRPSANDVFFRLNAISQLSP